MGLLLACVDKRVGECRYSFTHLLRRWWLLALAEYLAANDQVPDLVERVRSIAGELKTDGDADINYSDLVPLIQEYERRKPFSPTADGNKAFVGAFTFVNHDDSDGYWNWVEALEMLESFDLIKQYFISIAKAESRGEWEGNYEKYIEDLIELFKYCHEGGNGYVIQFC